MRTACGEMECDPKKLAGGIGTEAEISIGQRNMNVFSQNKNVMFSLSEIGVRGSAAKRSSSGRRRRNDLGNAKDDIATLTRHQRIDSLAEKGCTFES